MPNQIERSKHIIRDISLLYELALSIGQSSDLHTNVKAFLDILFTRKTLSFVSLWIKKSDGFAIQYARPHFRVNRTVLPKDHLIWKHFENTNQGCFSERIADSPFNDLQSFAEAGVLVFFKLGDFGFLTLHDAKREHPYSTAECNQLRKVMDKLTHTIAGCLAHDNLQIARQRIEDDEARFRQVINTSQDGVVIIDASGRIREWNKEAEQLFGYGEKEVKYRHLPEVILSDHWKRKYTHKPGNIIRLLDRAVKQQRRYEVMMRNRSDNEFPIEVSVSSFDLDDNLYFSLFIRDITERKASEASLIHARQAAEKAQLAEQQFLANMSHEIRTPMNAVIGMTHLLYKTELDHDQRELLDSIKFSADSLLEILNNILDLSKIEAGEFVPEEKPFNLNALLQSLYKSAQMKSIGSNVDVELFVDPGIKDYLLGDRTMLNQVLTNLMSNALKFTEKGTVKLSAYLLEKKTSGYRIRFKVMDTGIGIPMEHQESVFKDFKQVTSSIRGSRTPGTGLGLSIVKKLLSLMGGIIKMESQPGRGSVFSFDLDFSIFKTDVLLGEQAAMQPNVMESVDISGLKALVVEDNPMNQKLIGRILESWGVKYLIAENGKKAVQLSEERGFDFILMDLHMPEMNGVDATEIIRRSKANPNHQVPIIALTAAAMLEEKRGAMRVGMNDFMTKPFSPDVLKRMVIKWVYNQSFLVQNKMSMQNETTENLDLSYLEELSGGDKTFIGEMLRTFLTETTDILKELAEVESGKDYQRTYQVAHKLKSSLKMMGMQQAADLCVFIEEKARAEQNDDDLVTKIQDLKQRVEQTIPALKTEIEALNQ